MIRVSCLRARRMQRSRSLAVEAALAEQPELRAEVDSIRQLGAEMEGLLGGEAAPLCHAHQRDAVTAQASTAGSAALAAPAAAATAPAAAAEATPAGAIVFPGWGNLLAAAGVVFAAGLLMNGFFSMSSAPAPAERSGDQDGAARSCSGSRCSQQSGGPAKRMGRGATRTQSPNLQPDALHVGDEASGGGGGGTESPLVLQRPDVTDSEVVEEIDLLREVDADIDDQLAQRASGQPADRGSSGGWPNGLDPQEVPPAMPRKVPILVPSVGRTTSSPAKGCH